MKSDFSYRVKEKVGKALISSFGYLIDLIQGRQAYYSSDRIAGLKDLENGSAIILDELNQILRNREIPGIEEFFVEQKGIASNKSWKSFPLFVYGNEFEDNTKACPKTKELLLKIKGFSSAMFSILSAKQKIPLHKGPYKGVMRVHLGLKIPQSPKQSCFMQVDGVNKHWEFGRTMVFDDTLPHAAHNNSAEDRVVLFIDVIRPLPFPLSIINKMLFTAIAESLFIKETLARYKNFGNYNSSKINIKFN